MCYINHAIFLHNNKESHSIQQKNALQTSAYSAHYLYILLIHYHLATTIFAYRDIHLHGISRQKFFYQLWPLDEA